MTQKAINYAEVLCELNIDAAELRYSTVQRLR